jgi:hypothetical protein
MDSTDSNITWYSKTITIFSTALPRNIADSTAIFNLPRVWEVVSIDRLLDRIIPHFEDVLDR